MKKWDIMTGDCREVMAKLDAESVDAIVTDPPYGLSFMGKGWDHGVPGVEFWVEALRVAKPGAHLLAFGGTRTYHRLACAIEDAGWEIRDCVMWVYGCMSEDTEVLTPEGWERYNTARHKEILAYDPEADVYQWERPSRWSEYRVESDTAYRIESDQTDQIVSRNHRCLIERGGVLAFVAAEECSGVERVPHLQGDVFALSQSHGALLLADLLRQGEGLAQETRSERQGQEASWQGACWAEESGMERRADVLQAEGQVRRPSDQIRPLPGGVYGHGTHGWIRHGASAACGDGAGAVASAERVRASHQPRRDGQQAREPDAVCDERGSQAARARPSYRATLATVTPIEYTGLIFCPTVSTGAFVARRNGKVFLTGNSGFPKSLDVSKAIDKAAGAEREVVGVKENSFGRKPGGGDGWDEVIEGGKASDHVFNITAPATDAARQWSGWGTALKPSHEPVIVAHKPLPEDAERATIAENLSRLESQLCLLMSDAWLAEASLMSSRDVERLLAIARWTAGDRTNTRAALFGQMDTSQCELAIRFSLNTVRSWRSIWEDGSVPTSTFITATGSSTTIGWQTLKSCVSDLTLPCIIQAASEHGGSWPDAVPAAAIFNAVSVSTNSIRTLSAHASAIEQGLTPRPDAIDQRRLHRPIIVARKPLCGAVAENVMRHGTGAINVDASRIMTEDQERDADAYRRLSSLGSVSCIRGSSFSQLRGSLLCIASVLRSCSTDGTGRSRNVDDPDGILIDRALCGRVVARLFPNGVWCGGSSWSIPDSLCGCLSCRHSCDGHILLLREAAQYGAPSLADVLERICSGQFGLEHSRVYQCTCRPSSLDDSLLAWTFSFLAGEYCTLYSATPQNARWPANVIHDGSDEVVGLFPQSKSTGGQSSLGAFRNGDVYGKGKDERWGDDPGYGDSGSAARFFKCCPDTDPEDAKTRRMFYVPKASKADRDEGCEGLIVKGVHRHGAGPGEGIDPNAPAMNRNHHPTVKPTSLMRYLCRLVTPPGGVVLDPFTGSGSTGKAAVLEGFSFIGIEREAEYVEIAKARVSRAAGTALQDCNAGDADDPSGRVASERDDGCREFNLPFEDQG